MKIKLERQVGGQILNALMFQTKEIHSTNLDCESDVGNETQIGIQPRSLTVANLDGGRRQSENPEGSL